MADFPNTQSQNPSGESAARRAANSAAVQAAKELHCPQCGAVHQPTKLLGVDATECSTCRGVFLSEENAKAIQDLAAGPASS